ncbi:MAG: hypothetical protein PWQ94_1772 [Thermoanaerobacterium sp.]|nr:hypothetical protein [Thermoanaerobacterium sp.]
MRIDIGISSYFFIVMVRIVWYYIFRYLKKGDEIVSTII